MYAESRIAESLAGFKAQSGWMPEYHSIDEVDKANALIAADCQERPNGDVIFHPTPKQKRWIQNERALCWADANYWQTRYAYICDETNNIMRYRPRRSQQVFNSILAEFDEQQVAIEVLCLKARQQGISTEVALKFLHRLIFIPRVQGITASISDEKSELLNRILVTCVDMLPWWMVPPMKKNRTNLMEFTHGSILSIQSGSQISGIAQGWTPVLVHISECGDYPNPKKTLEEGLMRATHPSSSLFAVYEGTGNGNTGWWADSWRTAKERWPRGLSRLCPVFIPWHMASDLYPRADWLKKFPVPDEWEPEDEVVAHSRKCEAYVHHTPMLQKICGEDWKLPREQQWYWSFNYFEAKQKHCEKIWLQQMAADDREALISKNDTVFDQEIIEVISDEREREYQAYAIVGEGIDERYHPSAGEVDYNSKPRIEIDWDSNRGQHYEWLLVPVRAINELEITTAFSKLIIYEPPHKGCDYAIGGDIAGGIGDDRSVFSVDRKGVDEEPDVQAAEFISNRIGSVEIAYFGAAIAALYAPGIPNYRQPKWAIEQVRKYGDECQLQLQLMGFYRHHSMDRYDDKKPQRNKGRKAGFFTHTWSRPLLTGRFVDAVTHGWYKPNSPFLIRELADWEQRYTTEGKSRIDHQSGKHDDCAFAGALSYFTQHDWDVMLDRMKKRYDKPKSSLPEIDMGVYSGCEFRVSEGRERL
jgi:hypothetical protein